MVEVERNAKFSTPLKQFGLMRRIILNRNMHLIIISGTLFGRGNVFKVIFCFLLCLFFTMDFSFLRLMLVAAVCCCVCTCNVSLLWDEDASGFISMGRISLKSVKCPANNNRVTFNVLSDVFPKIVGMIRKYHNHKSQKTHGITRRSHTTITRHKEDKPSKANSSLFPIKMIAKLERTQSNVQQNIEQLQTLTRNNKQKVNNNRTIALERTAAYATGGGGA